MRVSCKKSRGGRDEIKLKNKEKTENSFQDWLKIKEIKTNVIKLQNGQAVRILKVLPINFNLKSQLEQKAILNAYKIFLKNLSSEIQIIISNKKTDVSKHFYEILKNTKENSPIYEMSQDYIALINSIISEKRTITKEFYIVIKVIENTENDVLKITEHLMNCGNLVEECSKTEIMLLLQNFLNKRVMNLQTLC